MEYRMNMEYRYGSEKYVTKGQYYVSAIRFCTYNFFQFVS